MADQSKTGLIRLLAFALSFYIIVPALLFVAVKKGLLPGPVQSILTSSVILYLLPTLVYLLYSDRGNILHFLKLRKNAVQGLIWGFGLGLIFAGYGLVVNQFVRGGAINLGLETGIWIWAIALVGILQEIPFRGFFLQKLVDHVGFLAANTITALFFVAFHIPRWYLNGKLPDLSSSLYLFVFSLFLGYVLKRSQSLWSCILFHSIHNLVSLTLL